MSNSLDVQETIIPGLYKINLILHSDKRGWFKENYQKEKLEALGLPSFNIVQNNYSFNKQKGAIRGLHAEPWEKYISLANGKVFCAWVDLRKGSNFGKVLTMELTPEMAVFVPRGVANSYQTLEENVNYTYLVNEHWSEEAQYRSINLFDPELNIRWPISQKDSIVSDKDSSNPLLRDITPMELK